MACSPHLLKYVSGQRFYSSLCASGSFYSFQARYSLKTGISLSLSCLQRSSLLTRNLFQSSQWATKVSLTWPPKCYCTLSISPNDALENQSSAPEKIHKHRRKLVVSSLSSQDHESSLMDHFSRFGEVEDIKIIRQRAYARISRAWRAFVVFKDDKALERALKEDYLIGSRLAVVSEYDYEDECTIMVSNLPDELNNDDVVAYFSQFGKVKSVNVQWNKNSKKRKPVGFVRFASIESALQALETCEHYMHGNIIKVSVFKSDKECVLLPSIWVNCLPDDITVEGVKDYFERFAPVTSVFMGFLQSTDVSRNTATISLTDVKAYCKILKENHSIINKEVIVQAAYSKSEFDIYNSKRDRMVFVDGIPTNTNEENVFNFFKQFGDVNIIKMTDSGEKRHTAQCALIQFKEKITVDIVSTNEVHMDESRLRVRKICYVGRETLFKR